MKRLLTFLLVLGCLYSNSAMAQPAAPGFTGITTICTGFNTTLTATGAAGATFRWWDAPTGGNALSPNAAYTIPTINSAGTYHYYVEQTSFGITSLSRTDVSVTVNQTPTIVITPAGPTICAGTTTILTATGAATYAWNTGSTTDTIMPAPTVTTNYTVTGTSALGCPASKTATITVYKTVASAGGFRCPGYASTLSASGAVTYTWQPGNLTGSSVSVVPLVTTLYTVTGAGNGCPTTDTVTLTVRPQTGLTVTPGPTVTEGNQANLNAAATLPVVFTWLPNQANNSTLSGASVNVLPTQTTTYTVTATDTFGCQTTATTTATVIKLPAVTGTTAICQGNTATLTATGTAPFTWYADSTAGTPLYTGATFVSPPVLTNLSYWVAGNGGPRKEVKLTVAFPLTTATATPATICQHDTTKLTSPYLGLVKYYATATGGMPLDSSIIGTPAKFAPDTTTTYYAEGTQTPVTAVFIYTGAVQTWTVPAGVTSIDVDLFGSKGSSGSYGRPNHGQGGRVQTTMNVTPGQVLNIYVGGTSLWNGGGYANFGPFGGDASDIRLNGTDLMSRVVVAGGGAGSGNYAGVVNSNRGDGGGLTGQDGTIAAGIGFNGGNNGTGGTQTAGGTGGFTPAAYMSTNTGGPGVFGNGGVATDYGGTPGGGGGGGWYGGGGGKATGDGGGGSSYTNPQVCTNVLHTQGAWDYTGVVYIRYGGACNGSATRVPVTVTVIPAPVLTNTLPATKAVCAGAPATFSITATGAVSYQWKKNGSNIAGATDTIYTIPATALADSGTYSVVATNATGCNTTAVCALTVNVRPVAGISGTASVCANATAPIITFTGSGNALPYTFYYTINGGATQAAVTNTGAIRYIRVQQNGSDFMHFAELRAIQAGTGTNLAIGKSGTGTTNGTTPVTNLTDGDITNYWHSTGQGTSQYVEVDLGAAYYLDHIELVNRQDCCWDREQNVQLILKDGSGATYSSQQINAYQNHNSNYTTSWGSFSGTTTIAAPTTVAGSYQYILVNATGANGCSATQSSSSATVTVNAKAAVTSAPVATQSLCAGNPFTLNVTANNAIAYQWQKNGANVAGATAAAYSILLPTTADSGTYRAIAIGAGGCSDTSAAGVVQIAPSAIATISGAATVCVNGVSPTITFAASGAVAPYVVSYNVNNGATQTVTVNAARIRYIRVQQNVNDYMHFAELRAIEAGTGTNVAAGKSGTATSDPSFPIARITDGSITNYWHSATTGTSQYVEVDLGAAYSLDHIELVDRQDCCWAREQNVQLILKDSSGAVYTSQQIDAYQNQNTNYKTNWPVASKATVTVPTGTAGTYQYNLTNVAAAAGCGGLQSGSATVIVGTPAVVTASPAATQTLCAGSPLTLTAVAGNAVSYQWRKNGVSIAGATADTYTIPAIALPDAGTYRAVAIGIAGCNDSTANSVVTVKALPTATLTGTATIICQGAAAPAITFTGAGATAPYTFTYTVNGGAAQTISTTSAASSVVLPVATATNGNYTYSLQSVVTPTSCSNTQTGTATISVGNTAGITASPVATQALCLGSALALSVTAGNAASYLWLKNGTAVSGATAATFAIPSITATDIGTYKVITTSNSGCRDTSAGSVITLNASPTATISGTAATCQNYAPVNLTFTGSGTPPYQFTYNVNGGPNQTILSSTRAARYVRLQQNNNANYLVISEVEAIEAGTGINVALNKPETVTGTPGTVTTATDGSYADYIFTPGSFGPAQIQYCEIDLGAVYNLSSIKISTYSGCCQSNQSGIILTLKDSLGNQVSTQTVNAYQNVANALTTTWPASGNAPATAVVSAPTAAAGTYQYNLVNVSYAGNCLSNQSGAATVTVKAAPTVTVQPVSSMAVCTTFPIELDAASSNVNDAYQWQVGGVNIPGETAPSYINYYANLTDAGTYRVLVTNNGCSTASTNSTVTVGTFNNTLATVNSTSSGIQSDGMDLTYTDANCKLIAAIADPAGGNILGPVNIAVSFDATVQTFGGYPYLQRHLDIQPTSNGPAIVKLYVRQQDFNAYNSYVTSNGNTVPLLPTGPTDAAGISHLVISQFHGAAMAGTTGPGGQYDATQSQTISGSALSATWASGYWTITMPVTGFSGFYIGSYSITPLAIDLTDISAENAGRVNNVNWTTATEADGDYFEVERSLDGVAYTQIGSVKGKSKSGADYLYTDEQPATGINYYRLRLMDAAGTGHYSKTVNATVKAGSLVLQVYPNPTGGDLTIHSTGAVGDKATITLTDLSGKTVFSTIMTGNETTISMNGLAAGLYLLHYADDAFHQTIKVTKE